jgi:acetyl esterase/lipase
VDLPYRQDGASEYERERCKLDLYLPEGPTGFATIVWFHGGGLRNGHKADDIAVGLARRFAGEGIAVASVNYRLSPQVKFPDYIKDAAAAVAFVCKRIVAYGGSDQRVFVSGHSAGGYLTAMIGMDPRYLNEHDIEADQIAGYMPVSGQMVTHSTVRSERGIPSTQPVVDEAAPAFYARDDAAPFLCIVGGEDLPARAEENRYFVAAMKAAGHPAVTYLEVEGRDHGTIASRMSENDDLVAQAVKDFIGNAKSR